MKTATKIFDRDNLKNMSPELMSEVIRRFNDYDILTKVMINTMRLP